LAPCKTVYNWQKSHWSDCAPVNRSLTCGYGVAHRTMFCVDPKDSRVPFVKCPSLEVNITVTKVCSLKSCSYHDLNHAAFAAAKDLVRKSSTFSLFHHAPNN